MLHHKITKLLHIDHPIIQAPMAGGVTTANLVAAVSNHGGLGSIGAGYMSPAQLREQIREVRKLTAGTFSVNLFVPNEYHVSQAEWQAANDLLAPIRERLQMQAETISSPKTHMFDEQLRVVIEEKVPVCSFTFGIPSAEVIAELKQHAIIVIGTATNVEEAIAIEASGMDIVVVQGSEAGGHRGTFIGDAQASLIGLMSLIPQVVDCVQIPVIAAGGIMDGRGLMAAVCLGAQAVQMGTAFLSCEESGAHPVHKAAIIDAKEDQTVVTRIFSGKWARGITNRFIIDMQRYETMIPDFPVQNALTQSIRKAAAAQHNPDYMSLWSGQSVRLAKRQTVETLMKNMVAEFQKTFK